MEVFFSIDDAWLREVMCMKENVLKHTKLIKENYGNTKFVDVLEHKRKIPWNQDKKQQASETLEIP